ncbi:hypothetical protein BLNAU_24886 [Blattamonas nauphoetae]|uniref:Uncharacterized protein n=1 Tax=Blattamonas nauphoetae TaxID=2049346 RepID=A0ABQ9WL74_9EUKA|nr:hypothetical protein BLNAU_24886 [Blattamonas nauphoetae]
MIYVDVDQAAQYRLSEQKHSTPFPKSGASVQPPAHKLQAKRSSNALRRRVKEGLFMPTASTDEFGCEDGDSCSEVLYLLCPHSVYKEEGQLSSSTLHSQIEDPIRHEEDPERSFDVFRTAVQALLKQHFESETLTCEVSSHDWRKGGSKFVANIVEEADEIEELEEGSIACCSKFGATGPSQRAGGRKGSDDVSFGGWRSDDTGAAGEEDKDRASDGRERPAAVGERVLKLIGEDRTLAREADERNLIAATKQEITKKKDPNTEMENAAAIEKNRIERARV